LRLAALRDIAFFASGAPIDCPGAPGSDPASAEFGKTAPIRADSEIGAPAFIFSGNSSALALHFPR